MLISCEKKEVSFEYRIEPALEVYVETFFEEAKARGISIPKENLIVEFTDSLPEDFCGQCERPKAGRAGQRIIQIRKNRDCWDIKVSQNKEALVFHELGHCLLGRDHKDEFFPNGAPTTIMTTRLAGPYEPCVYVFGDDQATFKCNKTVRRPYYLDELFNENLSMYPDWAEE